MKNAACEFRGRRCLGGAVRTVLVGDAGVRGVYSEGAGEGVEVILLLTEDVAEVFAEGELVELVGLLDAAAIVADGLLLVFEVEAEHVFGLFAGLDGLVGDGGHAAEEIDIEAEFESVFELFLGMDFELFGDIHVGGAGEDLGVVDVGDDGLELALQVFVEKGGDLLAGDGSVVLILLVLGWHEVRISLSGMDAMADYVGSG